MHEFGIMQGVVDLALTKAREHGAEQIHHLRLRVGRLSGVVVEALEFAHDVLTKGTLAEGSVLEIESSPVVCYCSSCQTEFEPEEIFYSCPKCGSITAEIRQGRELELVHLEVT